MFRYPIVQLSVEQDDRVSHTHPVPIRRSAIQSYVHFKGEDFTFTRRKVGRFSFQVEMTDSDGKIFRLPRGKAVRLRRGGKEYSFLFTNDFVRPDDSAFINFVICAAIVHLVLGLGLGWIGSSLPVSPKPENAQVDTARVKRVIEKMIQREQMRAQRKMVVERTPGPPSPRPEAPAPKKRAARAPRAPEPPAPPPPAPQVAKGKGPKAPPVPGPIKKAPPSPAPAVSAQAQAKARVSQSLNFLSSSAPAKFNVDRKNFGQTAKTFESGSWVAPFQAGDSKIPNMLNKISAGAANAGPIETKGARSIQTGQSFSGRAGGGDGKSLNSVQGRVALNRLYDYGGAGGEEMGGALGGGGLSMSGAGEIPKSLLEKALAKKLEQFQYCYEKALLSDPSLAGNVMIGWTIEPGGAATATHIVKSQLGNKQLHTCLMKQIQSIKFPSPKGGSVKINYPFNFTSSSL